MKNYKITVLMLIVILTMVAVLSGCDNTKSIFEVSGDRVSVWAKKYDRSFPDTLTVYIEHDGIAKEPQTITNAKITNEVFDTLSSMEIISKSSKDAVVFPNNLNTIIYHFRGDDGSAIEFTFIEEKLAVGDPINGVGDFYDCSGIDKLFGIGGIDLSSLTEVEANYQLEADNQIKDGDQGGEDTEPQVPEPQVPEPQEPQPEVPKEQDEGIKLVKYDGGDFTLMLPEGWTIQTMGLYTTFGFRAWDPKNPDYEIFSYGNLSPLLKSYEAKSTWESYVNQMGYPNAQINADAPVIDVYDASSLFYVFADLDALAKKYVPGFSIPMLQSFMAIETMPFQTSYGPVCTSEALVFGSLQAESGTNCHGKFTASILNTPGYYVWSVDLAATAALNVTGVIVPETDFKEAEKILTEAVFSLTFTEDYINKAKEHIKKTGEAAMASNAERQKILDAANAVWSDNFRWD